MSEDRIIWKRHAIREPEYCYVRETPDHGRFHLARIEAYAPYRDGVKSHWRVEFVEEKGGPVTIRITGLLDQAEAGFVADTLLEALA